MSDPRDSPALVSLLGGKTFYANTVADYVIFGPFEPGDRLHELFAYWYKTAGAEFTFGQEVYLDIRAFGAEPAKDGTGFTDGRPLFGLSKAAQSSLYLSFPGLLKWARIPLGWVAEGAYRWVGVYVYLSGVAQQMKGSLHPVVEKRP